MRLADARRCGNRGSFMRAPPGSDLSVDLLERTPGPLRKAPRAAAGYLNERWPPPDAERRRPLAPWACRSLAVLRGPRTTLPERPSSRPGPRRAVASLWRAASCGRGGASDRSDLIRRGLGKAGQRRPLARAGGVQPRRAARLFGPARRYTPAAGRPLHRGAWPRYSAYEGALRPAGAAVSRCLAASGP